MYGQTVRNTGNNLDLLLAPEVRGKFVGLSP